MYNPLHKKKKVDLFLQPWERQEFLLDKKSQSLEGTVCVYKKSRELLLCDTADIRGPVTKELRVEWSCGILP